MTKNSKIVFLTDLIEQRLRKESEIKFYEEQLKEITLNAGNIKR